MVVKFDIERAGQNVEVEIDSYLPLAPAWHRFPPVYVHKHMCRAGRAVHTLYTYQCIYRHVVLNRSGREYDMLSGVS